MTYLPLPILALVAATAPTWAQPPAPLIDLRLDGDTSNQGSLGGRAELVEHVPGEGAFYGLGVRGLAADFSNSSRSGGSVRTPAGGSLLFQYPELPALRRLTFALWCNPLADTGPARLIWTTRWDLMLSGGRLAFKTTGAEGDVTIPDLADHRLRLGEWSFVAVSIDVDESRAVLYLGSADTPPAEIGRWETMPEPVLSAPTLEIANLGGIRPFRGSVDNVRLYDSALGPAGIEQIHRSDLDGRQKQLRAMAPPRGMDALGVRHSDVFFSTRWARGNGLETAKLFHANRVVWVYGATPEFVATGRGAGLSIQGAINSVPRTPDLSAYCIDLDGTRLVAPWMVAFSATDPVKWGCCNQPAFREAVMREARAALDAGVDWLQFDDWSLNASAHSWGGGCMCDVCMDMFRDYLADLPGEQLKQAGVDSLEGFDYRRFLAEKHEITTAAEYKGKRWGLPTTPLFEAFIRRSGREFFQWLRGELDAHAGRRVPLSVNGSFLHPDQRNNYMPDLVDFMLGETSDVGLEHATLAGQAALASGQFQIVSPFPYNVGDARRALAVTYAAGQFYLAPWDIYMGTGKARHFGDPAHYEDLYGFIREHPALFDDYESPGTVGVVVDTDAWDRDRTMRLLRRLLRTHVPFRILLSGDAFYHLPIADQQVEGCGVIVLTADLEGLPQDDAQTLAAMRSEVPVLTDTLVSDPVLAELAPVDVWAPDCVQVVTRVQGGEAPQSLALHVLNSAEEAEERRSAPLRYVSVGLKPWAIPGPGAVKATWYAPGEEPHELMIDQARGLSRIIVPEVREWGIIKVEPAG